MTVVGAGLLAVSLSSSAVSDSISPREKWTYADPASVGIDPAPLQALDAEIRAGEHGSIDSMTIIRGGKIIFDRRYQWDYEA